MIIRATKKAMDKINKIQFDNIVSNYNVPLNEWYLNHFKLSRKSYFILTEVKSLYSIVFKSIGINSEETFKKNIVIICRKFEQDNDLVENSIDTKIIMLSKTSNRSILGSQIELIRMAESISNYEDEYVNLEQINETPMMYTGSFPIKDIKIEIDKRRNF